MNLHFTAHAKQRMVERNISNKDIDEVLDSAEKITPYRDGHRMSKSINGRTVLVGVTFNGKTALVVTVIDKHNLLH